MNVFAISTHICVHIKCKTFAKYYAAKFDIDISFGEFIRNCCVNLGINPDTVDGITKNVSVFIDNEKYDYDPAMSLRDLGFKGSLVLYIEPLVLFWLLWQSEKVSDKNWYIYFLKWDLDSQTAETNHKR